jgi:hypothetical protein
MLHELCSYHKPLLHVIFTVCTLYILFISVFHGEPEKNCILFITASSVICASFNIQYRVLLLPVFSLYNNIRVKRTNSVKGNDQLQYRSPDSSMVFPEDLISSFNARNEMV